MLYLVVTSSSSSESMIAVLRLFVAIFISGPSLFLDLWFLRSSANLSCPKLDISIIE